MLTLGVKQFVKVDNGVSLTTYQPVRSVPATCRRQRRMTTHLPCRCTLRLLLVATVAIFPTANRRALPASMAVPCLPVYRLYQSSIADEPTRLLLLALPPPLTCSTTYQSLTAPVPSPPSLSMYLFYNTTTRATYRTPHARTHATGRLARWQTRRVGSGGTYSGACQVSPITQYR